MKSWLMVLLALMILPSVAWCELYEWTDDAGVIQFTDNPGHVPEKYRKRVREREGIKSEPPKTGESRPVTSPRSVGPASAQLYDGRSLSFWKITHAQLNDKLKVMKESLEKLKEEQAAARKKRAIFQRGLDRRALAKKTEEVQELERKTREVEDDLATFMKAADQAGLPGDWRE